MKKYQLVAITPLLDAVYSSSIESSPSLPEGDRIDSARKSAPRFGEGRYALVLRDGKEMHVVDEFIVEKRFKVLEVKP